MFRTEPFSITASKSAIPKGLNHSAQGCEERATLGTVRRIHQLQRSCVHSPPSHPHHFPTTALPNSKICTENALHSELSTEDGGRGTEGWFTPNAQTALITKVRELAGTVGRTLP